MDSIICGPPTGIQNSGAEISRLVYTGLYYGLILSFHLGLSLLDLGSMLFSLHLRPIPYIRLSAGESIGTSLRNFGFGEYALPAWAQDMSF
jgi:hypothetical protein